MFIFLAYRVFEGKVSKSLVDLAKKLVDHLMGFMSDVIALACIYFGAVSGSGPAIAAVYGAVAAPKMEKAGYDWEFSAAVITAFGPLGVLTPQRILIVVCSVVAGTSIGALLVAGIGPALVTTLP